MRRLLSFCLFFCCAFAMMAQDATVFFEKGKQQFVTGDYTGALDNFTNALKLQPGLSTINYYIGLTDFNLKNYKDAIIYFKAELENAPGNINAYVLMAKAKSKEGMVDAAIKDMDHVIEADGQNAKNYLERGNIYFDAKNYKKALSDYNKALALNRNLQPAYYKKGFCNYYLKDTAAACESWSRLEDPDDYENYELISNVCKKN